MNQSPAFANARVLMIDNYDSFTYNLVQAFAALGAEMHVYRNDKLAIADALALEPTHVVISPGPGRPEDAGLSLAMIDAFAGNVPLLGVCLGHQSIVQHFGGQIVREQRLMHGKTSDIEHDGMGVFSGLSQPLQVGRYHSLAAEAESLPDCLAVTARTSRGEIMAVRHATLSVEGVQFHPESVLTPEGDALMANFLREGVPV
ncbi:MAG: aminodeoxychorismate/anthranilate synthase component II [Pseudomonadota bacterium]